MRKIKYLGVRKIAGWDIKIYIITASTGANQFALANKEEHKVAEWVKDICSSDANTYKIGTLIFHTWPSGVYAWLSWWTKKDLINLKFYFREKGAENFNSYPDNSMSDYIREFDVIWFESNQWHKHIIAMKPAINIEGYLQASHKDSIIT